MYINYLPSKYHYHYQLLLQFVNKTNQETKLIAETLT